jgi:hypothetical protein
MPISNMTKSIYTAVVLLAQIYLAYAATLYVDRHTTAFLYVVMAAVISAAGAVYYIFVQAKKDEVGGYNADFVLDERRRLG